MKICEKHFNHQGICKRFISADLFRNFFMLFFSKLLYLHNILINQSNTPILDNIC